MLDSSQLRVVLPKKTNGQDCLDQVCSAIGVLEKEYFGLQYTGKCGERLWLNARNPIKEQLGKGTHTLFFKVKFFIKPHKIIQPSTREQFYLQLKSDLLAGRLRTTPTQAATLTALIAQIELGDYNPSAQLSYDDCLVGVQFPDTVTRVTAEHMNLMGVSKIVSVERFLNEAQGLEDYGIEMHQARNAYTHEQQTIGVGSDSIYVYSASMDNKQRHSYSEVQFTAFHGRRFCMLLREPNYHAPKEHRYELVTKSAAQALYRSITEFHTFFRRETVGRIVKDAGYSTSLFATFKRNPVDRFYFDVLKTHREVVDHVWPLIHPDVPPVTLQRRNTTGNLSRAGRRHRNPPPPPSYSESSIARNLAASPAADNARPHESPARDAHSPPPEYTEIDSSFQDSGDSSLLQPSRFSVDPATIISRTRALEMELQRLKEVMMCRVCKSNPVGVTFCPCGHTLCCVNCAADRSQCLQCNEPITATQRVLLT